MLELETSVLKHIAETSCSIENDYCHCNELVLIGGVALFVHMHLSKSCLPMTRTKDADILIGSNEYQYLRDQHEVSFNARLKKHEYKVSLQVIDTEKVIDVDVYVNHMHSLDVILGDVVKYCITYEGVNIAHLVHLLVLKLDNYIEFDGNKESDKFRKIKEDIVQITALIEVDETSCLLLKENIPETSKRFIALKEVLHTDDDVCKSTLEFLQITETCIISPLIEKIVA